MFNIHKNKCYQCDSYFILSQKSAAQHNKVINIEKGEGGQFVLIVSYMYITQSETVNLTCHDQTGLSIVDLCCVESFI